MLIKKYCGFTFYAQLFFLISTNYNIITVIRLWCYLSDSGLYTDLNINVWEGGGRENDVSANHDGEFHCLFVQIFVLSDEMQYTVLIY